MIRKFQIFGERCSGTNYLEALIERNFDTLDITWRYGWKHGFYKERNVFDEDVLFLVIHRHPIDWLHSMRRHPWHAHRSLWNLEFSEFIRREWISEFNEHAGIPKSHPLYGREMPTEVHPRTGQRFANVLQMRTEKSKNWYELSSKVKHFLAIRYEDIRDRPKHFVVELAEQFEVRRTWFFHPVRSYKGKDKARTVYRPQKYPAISEDDRKFIRQQLDMDLESRMGYDV